MTAVNRRFHQVLLRQSRAGVVGVIAMLRQLRIPQFRQLDSCQSFTDPCERVIGHVQVRFCAFCPADGMGLLHERVNRSGLDWNIERDKLRFSETFAIVGPEPYPHRSVAYGVHTVKGHLNPSARRPGFKRAKLHLA